MNLNLPALTLHRSRSLRLLNWKHKAALQFAFSVMPLGEQLNYLFQRHITRSLPLDSAHMEHSASLAELHASLLRKHWGIQLEKATFYEFGAGWELSIPLTLFSLGINRQVVVDIRPLLRTELVNDVIAKLQVRGTGGKFVRVPAKLLVNDQDGLSVLEDEYGIEYLAPCDARRTGLPAASVDCITSTAVLEHIPPDEIPTIFQECRRILRDDGVISLRIDYQDHYSYFDRHISVYNFLQYPDRVWRFCSPSLHYQNRLRHKDYLCLIVDAGFEIVDEECLLGSEADMKVLEALPLDKRFTSYTLPQLAVRASNLVLRKSRSAQNKQ